MRNRKLAVILGVVAICLAAGAVNAETESKAARVAEQKRLEAEREAAKQAAFEKALPARLSLVDSVIKQYSREMLADAVHGADRLANFSVQVHQTSSQVLNAARSAGSVADFVALTERLSAEPAFNTKAALGDQVNLVFVPMGPCRIADSRLSTLGVLQHNVIRTYRNFSATGQGGTAGCNQTTGPGIIAGTSGAIALNVTVTGASFPGFVAVRPTGSTNTTSTINFTAGETLANGAVTKMTGGGASTDFEILPQMGAGQTVHVILDLLGFYVASEPAALDCVDTASTNSTTGTDPFFETTVTAPACSAGYTRVSLHCEEDNDAILTDFNIASGYCSFIPRVSGTSTAIHAAARCCRVPGNSSGRF